VNQRIAKDGIPTNSLLPDLYYPDGTGLPKSGEQRGVDVSGSVLDEQRTSIPFVSGRRNGLSDHADDERTRPSIFRSREI